MKRLVFIPILMIVCTTQGYSQSDTSKGICFEHNLSWQEVLQKAKAENKYIFVDCYASWCGPCRWMDRHVYVNDTVGDIVNKEFVAVKTQMDTTQYDNAVTREWYATAREFSEEYHISVYPTFLFFSPNGIIVHKAVRAINVQDFISLTKVAMDLHQQYYTLLGQYRLGTLQHGLMPSLANAANQLYDDSLSFVIATDYLNYLARLPDLDQWTKDDITFIAAYGEKIQYGDKIFQQYFRNRLKIDSIMGRGGYADQLINTVIYNEEVNPRINAGIKDRLEPDWHEIQSMIKRKYGTSFVKANMLMGRVSYYRKINKWDKYIKYLLLEVQHENIESLTPGPWNSLALNNNAFEVFKYCTRKHDLKVALSWIKRALMMNAYQAQELDTKANLLYKLGKQKEAIACEEKSFGLAPGDKDIQSNYEKMKNGQPTW